MPPVGFEPTISAGVRPKTYALDRAATETGIYIYIYIYIYYLSYCIAKIQIDTGQWFERVAIFLCSRVIHLFLPK